MPSRLKRYQQQGDYHAINFSCYHRLPYLNDDHTRIVFEQTLEQLRQRHQFFLFGYVIMPNHVHLLLTEPKLHSLATTLSVLKGETSKLLKGDRPQFWQSRYYDFNVLTHQKYVEKLKYIHRNPVDRGLVEKPEDWHGRATAITSPANKVASRSNRNTHGIDAKSKHPTHRDKATMNGAPKLRVHMECPGLYIEGAPFMRALRAWVG